MQAYSWSAGYVLFVVICAATAWHSRRTAPASIATADREILDEPHPRFPSLPRSLLWCSLAATGSVLLLSVTNHITQNIAAVPLLWIVPLTIYLITFILCFDSSRWYPRELLLPAVAATLGVMAWCLADPRLTHELELQLAVFCGGPVRRLHVLPRRARAAQAGAALPDALLPDGVARRRDRRGAGRHRRAARAARALRAGTRT